MCGTHILAILTWMNYYKGISIIVIVIIINNNNLVFTQPNQPASKTVSSNIKAQKVSNDTNATLTGALLSYSRRRHEMMKYL